jgi:hypothetical protein
MDICLRHVSSVPVRLFLPSPSFCRNLCGRTGLCMAASACWTFLSVSCRSCVSADSTDLASLDTPSNCIPQHRHRDKHTDQSIA